MRTTSNYRIALVNNANPSEPSHWAPNVSVREQRAVRLARKLRVEGNTNVILFKRDRKTGNWFPMSIRQDERVVAAKQYDAADAKTRRHAASYGASEKVQRGLKFSDRALAALED